MTLKKTSRVKETRADKRATESIGRSTRIVGRKISTGAHDLSL